MWLSIVAVGVLLVTEDERDLYNSSQSSSHQGVAKHLVDHSAEHEMLWVTRHSPTSNEDDETRDEVALWSAMLVSAQPHPSKTRSPPDDAHSSVLDVVFDPSSTPVVLGEGIDAAPCCYDQ